MKWEAMLAEQKFLAGDAPSLRQAESRQQRHELLRVGLLLFPGVRRLLPPALQKASEEVLSSDADGKALWAAIARFFTCAQCS